MCTDCDAGYTTASLSSGQTTNTCTQCVSGYFGDGDGNGSGANEGCTLCDANADGCTTTTAGTCNAGYYGTAASVDCAACSAGKFKTAAGDGDEASVCLDCVLNSTGCGTSSSGSGDNTSPGVCAAGYGGSVSTACVECQAEAKYKGERR